MYFFVIHFRYNTKTGGFRSLGVQNFKLEEEEKPRLLLHLPKLFVDAAVFGSASGLGCWQVVAIAQVGKNKTACFWFAVMGWRHMLFSGSCRISFRLSRRMC
jgi:hypothetical protein